MGALSAYNCRSAGSTNRSCLCDVWGSYYCVRFSLHPHAHHSLHVVLALVAPTVNTITMTHGRTMSTHADGQNFNVSALFLPRERGTRPLWWTTSSTSLEGGASMARIWETWPRLNCLVSVHFCRCHLRTSAATSFHVDGRGLIMRATQTSDGTCFKTWVLHRARGLVTQWLRWAAESSCSVESHLHLREEMIME